MGIVGVLLTRGQPTIIYPEQTLTFRLEAPVTISTARAPLAFRYVEPGDYQQADLQRRPPHDAIGGPVPAYYAPGYYAPLPLPTMATAIPTIMDPASALYFGRGYYGWRR